MSRTIIIYIVSAVVAVTFHEAAHGYAANFFGDPTAKNAGRLTLNPIKHIDPFGTVVMPVILAISGLPVFGYAKPVPVTISRLRKPRNESVLVALAGPGVNIAFVAVAIGICRLTGVHFHSVGSGGYITGPSAFTLEIAQYAAGFGLVNLMLAIFNLLPIPPLDGSAVVERLVPRRYLPSYFALRQRALPFLLILLLLNSFYFHLGSGLQNNLLDVFERLAFGTN